jgi:hypothetical protein
MKLTATNYDITISIERPDDLTISELLEMFKIITLGITFAECQWNNAICDLAEEINETKNNKL